MTHIVPERVVGVPVQPVAVAPVVVSNVKFEIKGTEVTFYETPEAPNNIDVFETFDLARSAAIQAFAKHKANVLAAITQTEKELLTAQGPTTVAANSPAIHTTPIV
jgi:hypothetical protein